MSLFKWDDLYSVGFDEIDRQHKRLFAIANDYHGVLMNQGSRTELGTLFGELLDYTHYHFEDEERVLQRCNYPQLTAHHTNHEKLLKIVLAYQKQFSEGVPGIEQQCMEFIRNWLNAHILGADKQYSSYVAARQD